tara:strand:+ start:1109 stop:1300 length:192 start_codon:yes stop_codon:yes gene_type:complete
MEYYSLFVKLKGIKPLKIDPVKKLTPTIKLTGNSTVSIFKSLTLVLFELFCIPTKRIKNKQKL